MKSKRHKGRFNNCGFDQFCSRALLRVVLKNKFSFGCLQGNWHLFFVNTVTEDIYTKLRFTTDYKCSFFQELLYAYFPVLISIELRWKLGGYSPKKPYMYAAPKGRVFSPFWSENGYFLCSFWSGIRYCFQKNYWTLRSYLLFYFQMSTKAKKYANSKRISRNRFCCCSNLSNVDIIS